MNSRTLSFYAVIMTMTMTMALLLCLVPAVGCASESYTPELGQAGKDVVWVPTSHELADVMLDKANVTSSDFVIDLGSGDGRLVIAAAKRGATALGIEYNPDLVEYSIRAAAEEGVSELATFVHADIFESDFSEATVLTLFLMNDLNLRLRPTILDMTPGTRVVSNTFHMGDWLPDETTNIGLGFSTALLWIVPAKVDGVWMLDDGHIMSFTQEFQDIAGFLTIGEEHTPLTGKLSGDTISFIAGDAEYTGTVSGNTISGTRTGGEFWQATR